MAEGLYLLKVDNETPDFANSQKGNVGGQPPLIKVIIEKAECPQGKTDGVGTFSSALA